MIKDENMIFHIYILIFNLNINDSLNFYKFGITINRIKT